ncbi:MAG TPA: hydrogenase maturation protease [Candidatus Sulfotelmatobacter sp.]|nr:hydrogenase maturation protease [Candidatus Sulfotelmatobacter sp.]
MRSPAVSVDVFVCGSPDRGDDGAAVRAAEAVRPGLPPDVRLRTVGQLDVEDLLAVPADAGVVIVDVATGLVPGTVVDLPLADLAERGGVRPHSSHSLAVSGVVALAELLGGRPLRGRVIALGGQAFGFGDVLSAPVAAAVPRLGAAIGEAIERVRAGHHAVPGGAPCA